MPRILLLCFIHGFKGNDDTFREFPHDLKRQVSRELPDDHVESVVYPTYETKGELHQASQAFLEWLQERVMDVRKAHLEKPWPPNDREVGVILVAHSMGGFVAADALFLSLNERLDSDAEGRPPFPLIQGILTFDTPYNGLARSMFVYGAFSNYQKVSNVFNVMTALGAAAPAGLRSLATKHATRSAVVSAGSRSNPAWKTWQLVAVRTGTVGAIAAGGVAAYMHREAIMKGMQKVRNINKETVADGYRQSMETLGQGLAYVNRGNVGHSFAWLSDHFTFVGSLMKQQELCRRLDRMGALKGVGIRDFYTSLGANGYWSGGYFVPERTFCAVPAEDHAAHSLFTRYIMRDSEDEVMAHITMFKPEKNEAYERMTSEAVECVKQWFLSEEPLFDDPKYREVPPEEAKQDKIAQETLEEQGETSKEGQDNALQDAEKAPAQEDAADDGDDDSLPDESPIDIAAAASMVPLPDDAEGDLVGSTEGESADANDRKRTYRQYLFQIAQQTGSGAKAWWPSKLPEMPQMPQIPQMPQMPTVSMPSMPQMPSAVSSLDKIPAPSWNMFSKNKDGKNDAKNDKMPESAETT
ncbi:alpha/beta-Hydrolase [Purpureocillium lavendulum]|uniref:Alpha/beta-Hydrolase n=1 Tax=Purpureocillium lavendulum TaxID=1247861 RepID=A0AB34FWZ1_9HYPO|nr:alpha/beta-Hydrolase [Purpureocillium lavendulum]